MIFLLSKPFPGDTQGIVETSTTWGIPRSCDEEGSVVDHELALI